MKNPPTANQSRISEIFSSLQGEGVHVGERHIFVRFEECHIHCQYCDELDKRGYEMTLDAVMESVRELERRDGPHSFVSLTGGEPLLYLVFLKPLLQRLKAENFKTYLETDGILWRALEEVIGWCDCVAMDMKPSSVTKEKNFFEEHRRFLQIAQGKDVFIKMVLSKEIDLEEFDALVQIAAEVSPSTPLVLQPLSGACEGHDDAELMELLARLHQRAAQKLQRVSIVPRLHKILKIR